MMNESITLRHSYSINNCKRQGKEGAVVKQSSNFLNAVKIRICNLALLVAVNGTGIYRKNEILIPFQI